MGKACSKCKNSIDCQVDDVNNCFCSKIVLSDHTKDVLEEGNYDCLCIDCLRTLEGYQQLGQQKEFKNKRNIPDLDYYVENGKWVFTEYYHYQKGYCCKNNCRHCVYGYQKSDLKNKQA